MKVISVLKWAILSIALSTPGIAQNKIEQDVASILCRGTPWDIQGKIPSHKIVIFGTICEAKWDDRKLYAEIEKIIKTHPHYSQAVLYVDRESKTNHRFSMNETPYTDSFIIKIDFNHISGNKSTSKWYLYNVSKWLAEISNIEANTRIHGAQK